MSAIKVSVTAAHIANAMYPRNSPIALALREIYSENVHVTQRFAYIGNKVYALPESAIASEIKFDFLAKGGVLQGEANENILPYTFEMKDLKQDA
jgi:hypothetical protein